MTIELPLDRMTLAEKLAVMETLWEDLSANPTDVASPDWHADVLNERRQLFEQGKMNCQTWESAMQQLREEIHGNPPA